MSIRNFLLLVFSIIFFGAVYELHPFLIQFFKVEKVDFVQNFYHFITAVTLLMLLNLVTVNYFKPQLTGYMFLAWSMLKIMLVMGYFVVFVLIPKRQINNAAVFDIAALYFLYLFFEVIFTVFLLHSRKPAQNISGNHRRNR